MARAKATALAQARSAVHWHVACTSLSHLQVTQQPIVSSFWRFAMKVAMSFSRHFALAPALALALAATPSFATAVMTNFSTAHSGFHFDNVVTRHG